MMAEKALKAYKTYSELRTEEGKESRIPSYLKERITKIENNEL